MTSSNPKSERIYIRLTPAMHQHLAQMMANDGYASMSDAGREAIRFYIDHRADAIGSRRHFARSMQTRLDEVEDFVHAQSAVQTYMLAQSVAQQMTLLEQVLAALTQQEGELRKTKGSDVLGNAVKIAQAQQASLRTTVDKLRELIQQQRSEKANENAAEAAD